MHAPTSPPVDVSGPICRAARKIVRLRVEWIGTIVIGLVSMAANVHGQPLLTSQRVEGMRRVCIYGTQANAPTRRIGSGEPCPSRYRAPEPEVQLVPSMAILVGEDRRIGQVTCLYRYAGRDYRTLRPAALTCPLTPASEMQVLNVSSDAGGNGQ
jgi:hypothetical protein